jgi:RNA polymerase sigma-70 factor (ECF subfamily)
MAASPTTDEQLIRQLYAEHAGALLMYARNLLGGDYVQAEDVVQETLLRAWRHPEVFARAEREGSSVRGWLITVTRNIVIDVQRARRARPPEVSAETLLAEPPSEDAAFNRVLAAQELEDALASLSPEHRAVINELYFGDRTVAGAASVLQIPEGTVKSRAYYGLRALRVACEERGIAV